jgi:hypothetical protein
MNISVLNVGFEMQNSYYMQESSFRIHTLQGTINVSSDINKKNIFFHFG